MRSAFGSSYILRGRKGEQPRTCPDCEEQSNRTRLCLCRALLGKSRHSHAVIAGLTRNPCTDDHFVSRAAWIAGQARNDSVRLSCRTRSGIHAGQNKRLPQSRAWADCSSQSRRVAWAGCSWGPAGCTSSRRRIASCARHLARESCLNIATKERREFFRVGRKGEQTRFPDGTEGCRGAT